MDEITIWPVDRVLGFRGHGYSMSLNRNFTPPVPSCCASRAYAWPSGVATAAQAAA
jgi:hypothetical protein